MQSLRYYHLAIYILLGVFITSAPINVYANGLSVTLTPGFIVDFRIIFTLSGVGGNSDSRLSRRTVAIRRSILQNKCKNNCIFHYNRTTEPQGPNPNNPNNYKEFTFSFTITGMRFTEYYDITAKLDSTSYRGSMANYGGSPRKDLQFHRDDYISSQGIKLLVWDYNSQYLRQKIVE